MLKSKKNHLGRMMVAGFACALSAMACGQVSDESVAEDIGEEGDALVLEDSDALVDSDVMHRGSDARAVCFDIGSDRRDDIRTNGGKITHIFLDVDWDRDGDRYRDREHSCDEDDIEITVDGERVNNLRENGGPCRDIERDVWFNVGNHHDDEIEVCVFFLRDRRARSVSVGAKVGGRCEESCEKEC